MKSKTINILLILFIALLVLIFIWNISLTYTISKIQNTLYSADENNNLVCVDEFRSNSSLYQNDIQRVYVDNSTNNKYVYTYYYDANNCLVDTEILLIKIDGTYKIIKEKGDNFK